MEGFAAAVTAGRLRGHRRAPVPVPAPPLRCAAVCCGAVCCGLRVWAGGLVCAGARGAGVRRRHRGPRRGGVRDRHTGPCRPTARRGRTAPGRGRVRLPRRGHGVPRPGLPLPAGRVPVAVCGAESGRGVPVQGPAAGPVAVGAGVVPGAGRRWAYPARMRACPVRCGAARAGVSHGCGCGCGCGGVGRTAGRFWSGRCGGGFRRSGVAVGSWRCLCGDRGRWRWSAVWALRGQGRAGEGVAGAVGEPAACTPA